MRKSLFFSLVALICSVVALVKVYTPAVAEKATAEAPAQAQAPAPVVTDLNAAVVEEVLNNKPEIVVNAMQKYEQNMREQALAQAREMLKSRSEELNNDKNSPFVGPKNAKVVLVEFFDYACGYCHRLYPELDKVMENNSDVKFVFKPMAFVAPYSDYAGRAAIAAAKQGKFKELHTAMFTAEGGLNEDAIDALAAKAGLNVEKFKADIQSEEVSQAMAANQELAASLQINGVPTMILNSELLQTLNGEEIQRRIDNVK